MSFQIKNVFQDLKYREQSPDYHLVAIGIFISAVDLVKCYRL